MKLIERSYLNELITAIGTPDIKIITGVRRSGKSKLLEQFIDYIQSHDTLANIISINFNLLDFEDLKDYHALYRFIKESYKGHYHNYLLIDEVQMCNNFESVINSLHAEELFDIYLTGSNAFLLSSDLATLFTGRFIEIPLFPFSFQEYLAYYGDTYSSDIFSSFDRYSLEGGMAGSYLYSTSELKSHYLQGIYNTIIERDLIKRKALKNKPLLLKIASYLMDNIGNLTSPNSIAHTLSTSTKISDKTVNTYIKALCESFLFYPLKRYDIKGKKYLSTHEKYYLCDTSFKYALLGKKDMNYGHIYENIIAIELLRRGYEVYVGMLYDKEIDFVAIKKDEKIYIQVSDDISNETTFKREIDALLKINDAYPKYLIARTYHERYTYQGVNIIDIAEWLK